MAHEAGGVQADARGKQRERPVQRGGGAEVPVRERPVQRGRRRQHECECDGAARGGADHLRRAGAARREHRHAAAPARTLPRRRADREGEGTLHFHRGEHRPAERAGAVFARAGAPEREVPHHVRGAAEEDGGGGRKQPGWGLTTLSLSLSGGDLHVLLDKFNNFKC